MYKTISCECQTLFLNLWNKLWESKVKDEKKNNTCGHVVLAILPI